MPNKPKLSPEDVADVRRLYELDEHSYYTLGRLFKVSHATIYKVICRKHPYTEEVPMSDEQKPKLLNLRQKTEEYKKRHAPTPADPFDKVLFTDASTGQEFESIFVPLRQAGDGKTPEAFNIPPSRPKIVQLIPADGVRSIYRQDDGSEFARLVIGYALYSDGSVAPLDVDDEGEIDNPRTFENFERLEIKAEGPVLDI